MEQRIIRNLYYTMDRLIFVLDKTSFIFSECKDRMVMKAVQAVIVGTILIINK